MFSSQAPGCFSLRRPFRALESARLHGKREQVLLRWQLGCTMLEVCVSNHEGDLTPLCCNIIRLYIEGKRERERKQEKVEGNLLTVHSFLFVSAVCHPMCHSLRERSLGMLSGSSTVRPQCDVVHADRWSSYERVVISRPCYITDCQR